MMTAKLYADLEQRIQAWVDAQCEHKDWPEVVVGLRTAKLMANAARNVFDACVESQAYAKREGYMQ